MLFLWFFFFPAEELSHTTVWFRCRTREVAKSLRVVVHCAASMCNFPIISTTLLNPQTIESRSNSLTMPGTLEFSCSVSARFSVYKQWNVDTKMDFSRAFWGNLGFHGKIVTSKKNTCVYLSIN
jgi:hypothetical protein